MTMNSSRGRSKPQRDYQGGRRIPSNNPLQRKVSRYDGNYTQLTAVLEEDMATSSRASSPAQTPREPLELDVNPSGKASRRNSTKLLISRFEALNSIPLESEDGNDFRKLLQQASRPLQTLEAPPDFCALGTPSETGPDIGRNIISSRRSFKSFFGAFKKKSGTSYVGGAAEEDLTKLPTSLATHSLAKLGMTNSARLRREGASSASPNLRSLPVLYLSEPETSSSVSCHRILPVWTLCILTLHPSHLALSSISAHGTPETRTFSLGQCTDVRSLSRSELGTEEWAMLPSSVDGSGDNDGGPKMFAAIFEGRPRGTFAAKSVTERAQWVSSIWEAVLAYRANTQSQSDTTRPQQLQGLPTPPKSRIELPQRSVIGSASLPSASQGLLVPNVLNAPAHERSLPPTPNADKNNGAQARPRTRSFPQAPVYQSPLKEQRSSIRNLSERSVVKQRLAQMQPGKEHLSLPGPATLDRARNRPPKLLPLILPSSLDLSETDSIIDSYCTSPSPSPQFGQRPTPPLASPASSDSSYSPLPTPLSEHPSGVNASQAIIQPVIDVLEAQAVNQHDQLVQFEAHFDDLRENLQNLAEEVAKKADASPDDSTPAIIDAVEDVREALLDTNQGIQELDSKIDALILKNSATISADVLDELRRIKTSNESSVQNQECLLDGITELTDQVADLDAALGSRVESVLTKLDDVLAHAQNFGDDSTTQPRNTDDKTSSKPSDVPSNVDEQLHEVVALLKDGQGRQQSYVDRNSDNARYLGELNSWLEGFVNNHSTHHTELTTMLQQITASLGASGVPGQSLVSELKQLLTAGHERNNALHKEVQDLVASVAGNGQAPPLQAVTALLENQRQVQEHTFKAFAAEMAAEIKGERLRFVDAMKEATSIHVQMHIDQFRKELAHEVAGMSQEVGRLQQEREGLARQLSELRAFHARHQQMFYPTPGLQPPYTTPRPQMRAVSGPQAPYPSQGQQGPYPPQALQAQYATPRPPMQPMAVPHQRGGTIPAGPHGLGMTPSMPSHYQNLSRAQS